MVKRYLTFLGAFVFILVHTGIYCDEPQISGSHIKISGDVMEAEDISAVAGIYSFIAIGSDESDSDDKNYIQLLKKDPHGAYAVFKNIFLFEGDKENGREMDIEGITSDGDNLYIIGSHSLLRKKIKTDKSYDKNLEKFRDDKIEDSRSRCLLYRVGLNSAGEETGRDKISLKDIIRNDKILKTFNGIPGKENGVDIEGIAIKDGWLYAGFRGPVFRGNYVPVMKFRFDNINDYSLLFVNLGGRGIRDITSVSDGFLILAGPVGDGPGSYQLYHWNGKDIIPGKKRKTADMGKLRLLGEIKPPPDGKAEGLAVLEENDKEYHLIIAFDGVKDQNRILQSLSISKQEP